MEISPAGLGQAERPGDQLGTESFASKIYSVVLKVLVAIIGAGIGGCIGLIIAVSMGIIEFRC